MYVFPLTIDSSVVHNKKYFYRRNSQNAEKETKDLPTGELGSAKTKNTGPLSLRGPMYFCVVLCTVSTWSYVLTVHRTTYLPSL